ncbi:MULTISPECIES: ABC transporter ATP-binding protein [Arthrobacter]|uniref:Multidrug ABC transporter ATP-binding protein n=1 Tax=Arthrobacter psychrochitiniphilus TaxID=291045 RepID=A0A2V3DQ64_9MICC|nr:MULTISPECIES: ABC transporter ATP-binding protein [Arthrobacter]NYG17569.1 ATP-binding cassette subfamily B protein [Arthrobacter psychrochitiniphilus]PXA64669.1 multidrug ABC transporter ATP-binding protein [Arthrobacter psychrochitiniphilus]
MLFQLIARNLAPHKGPLIAIVVLQFLSTLASLYLPTLNADIIDDGVVKGQIDVIMNLGLWMLLITAGQVVCAIAATFLSARLAMGVGRQIRRDLFNKVESFSSQEMGTIGAPSLITRTTNDVQQVQMLTLMSFTLMVTAPIMCIGGIVLAMAQDVPLSGLLLVILPVLIIAISLIVRVLVPTFRKVQRQLDDINGVLREQITGISVIRAFGRRDYEAQRFATANGALTTSQLRAGRLMALMFPTIFFVVNITSVGVLWFGGQRIDAGQMQIGALTAFLSYIMQILMAVMMAMFMFMMIPRAAVSAERITEVLTTEPTVMDAPNAISLDRLDGVLRVHDATFSYPGAQSPVLSGVSFNAGPGTTTAIIGSTGSGKSTLVNLIPRLLDTTQGSIELGGYDVKALSLATLRSSIGLVPQRAYLFSGTVASNIRMGNPQATDEQLWQALETAQAADFVRNLPEGLEAPIEQGGSNVSGGQRQRLCIARAIAAQPAVYLFDDSFSALDYVTDAKLRMALKPVTRDAAVLVVAQRVGTVKDADNILVLDEGKLVGQGTHEELLLSCPTYQEIVTSQINAEDAQEQETPA